MYEDIKKIKTGDFVCQSSPKRPRIKSERTQRTIHKKKSMASGGLLVRTAICGLLLVIVLLIVYIDMPVTNRMKSGLVSALTFEIDVDKSLGKLKFVQSNDSTIESVMSTSTMVAMELPIKNAATVSNYSDDNKSMVFEATELTDIVCPSAGIVENVDSDREFAITIDHGNNVKSVLTFNGAMAVIKDGNVLKKGDYVGIIDKGATLTFTVIKNGQNVDPSDYIQQK